MGLDMYAFKTREAISPVDFQDPEDAIEIAYWRKHPNLHGWMKHLYYKKGGTSESFNCDAVRLDAEDIDALEKAVNNDDLPHTTGFFFSESRPEEKHIDLRFIEVARAAIREGYSVYYSSWW